MIPRVIEAMVDEEGKAHPLKVVKLPAARRALLIVLDEAPATCVDETVLLSEAALAEDWSRPEGGAAWSRLRR